MGCYWRCALVLWLRFWVGTTIANRMGAKFPYGTFVINLTACVVIGFSLAFLGRRTGAGSSLEGSWSLWALWARTARFPPLNGKRSLGFAKQASFLIAGLYVILSVALLVLGAVGCGVLICEGCLMRANKVINYTSILQVLGEPGCPFCRFMKDVQAAVLQTPGRTVVHHLCNFHTWGLAANTRSVLPLRRNSS